MAQVRPRIQEMEQELLAGLPEDELQLCTKVLEQLDRRIATIRPG